VSTEPTVDFWAALRPTTTARVGLGRAGDSVPTHRLLELQAAHAVARDAVHASLDVDATTAALAGLRLGEPVLLPSAAPDRATYLARPDLGRTPAAHLAPAGPTPDDSAGRPDLAVVVADGLSAQAVHRHAVPLLEALLPLVPQLDVAAPWLAVQARVALGDHVGAHLGAAMTLVLIGERPGLSSSDSLGAYLTWGARPGTPDSARNCVSNIRPPHGLDHATAARTLASLMEGARRLGATGVRLKDRPDALT
jgi:ethanolamine ammonia-lyase small subunit